MSKKNPPGSIGLELCSTPDGDQMIEVTYTQGKEYMVLQGKEKKNIFMSSGSGDNNHYRHDWYDLVAECDSYDEARTIIDKHYMLNPIDLFKAIWNSSEPDKL
jgi:hypothetical protein